MIVIDGEVFLEHVGPLIRAGDLRRLARFVEANWSCEELRRLLDSNVDDARAAAAITLGLVAQVHYTPVLAEALHDPATAVADAAEQALWRLWFNGGAHAARPSFELGLSHSAARRFDDAAAAFSQAIAADPAFAEAWNQRAVARYLLGDWDGALRDCVEAVNRIPLHFGAIEGMGHCHAQQGDFKRAAQCYRRALQVNPRLQGVAEALERVRRHVT